MSYVITTDVFCDGKQCSSWINGESGIRIMRKAAKESAERYGWLVKGNLAYCPLCKQNLMYQKIKGKDQE